MNPTPNGDELLPEQRQWLREFVDHVMQWVCEDKNVWLGTPERDGIIDAFIASTPAPSATVGGERSAHDFVPGAMHCAKCNFRLQRNNLYYQTGNIGPGDNKTEPCPNGCGPLWPVTWKMDALEGDKVIERLMEENKQLKASTLATPPAAPSDAVRTEGILENKQRCKELYQKMQRDAMLRQGDPVQTLHEFAMSMWQEGFSEGYEDSRALTAPAKKEGEG